jgi:hypothetical protein
MKYAFHPEAEADFHHAIDYYEDSAAISLVSPVAMVGSEENTAIGALALSQWFYH